MSLDFLFSLRLRTIITKFKPKSPKIWLILCLINKLNRSVFHSRCILNNMIYSILTAFHILYVDFWVLLYTYREVLMSRERLLSIFYIPKINSFVVIGPKTEKLVLFTGYNTYDSKLSTFKLWNPLFFNHRIYNQSKFA